MRCLSPHQSYSIQVIEGQEQIVVDARGYAMTHTLGKPVIANFDRSGLLDHEIEAALTNFNFSGLPEGVNPLTRISVFDTEAYCEQFPKDKRDELQVQIDQRLRELQERHPSEFIIVESPVAAKPWGSYDEDTIEDIVKFQERLEIEPELIRLYESDNQKREEIIEAMFRIESPEAAEAIFGPVPVFDQEIEVIA